MDPNRELRAQALLEAGGATTMPHPGGTLLAHLRRTSELLTSWGASQPLVLAGLCHAAYGTDGFDHALLDVADRRRLAAVITTAGEQVVYLYGSCDRPFTYPHLASGQGRFRDRFTGTVGVVGPHLLHQFAELTFANELDIVNIDPIAAEPGWPAMMDLLDGFQDLVSTMAWNAYQQTADAMRVGSSRRHWWKPPSRETPA